MKEEKDNVSQQIINTFGFPWEKGEKPFFVNEEGFEWYFEKTTTEWAHRESQGVSLKNIFGVLIKKGDKIHRVLMDKNTNEVIYENGSLEAIVSHIDMLKFATKIKK